MSEDYTKVVEYLKNIKSKGKAVYYVGDKWIEADYNFDPPKIRKIETDAPEVKEKKGGREMRISDDAGYEVEQPDENNNKGKEV